MLIGEKEGGNGVCWKRIQVKISKPLALVSEEVYDGVTLTLVSRILIEHLTAVQTIKATARRLTILR